MSGWNHLNKKLLLVVSKLSQILLVTSLGWKEKPFRWLSDFQLGHQAEPLLSLTYVYMVMTDSTSALLSPPPYVHWSNDRCVLLSSGRCGVRDLLPATRSRKDSMSGCMVFIENGFVQKISSEDLTHPPSWETVVTWTTVFIMFVSYFGFERLRRGLDCYVFLVLHLYFKITYCRSMQCQNSGCAQSWFPGFYQPNIKQFNIIQPHLAIPIIIPKTPADPLLGSNQSHRKWPRNVAGPLLAHKGYHV